VSVLSQIPPEVTCSVKALVLRGPGEASVETVPDPVVAPGELLLRVRMVGFCGSDLNSFRGRNPLVSFPRILGHEVSATVIAGDSALPTGTDVTLSPYTSCGQCASCRRGRTNACQFNQTLGVQRETLTGTLRVSNGWSHGEHLPVRVEFKRGSSRSPIHNSRILRGHSSGSNESA
jgi:threonine dehydrogenase-like Zn-dependent dehydrogenase